MGLRHQRVKQELKQNSAGMLQHMFCGQLIIMISQHFYRLVNSDGMLPEHIFVDR